MGGGRVHRQDTKNTTHKRKEIGLYQNLCLLYEEDPVTEMKRQVTDDVKKYLPISETGLVSRIYTRTFKT